MINYDLCSIQHQPSVFAPKVESRNLDSRELSDPKHFYYDDLSLSHVT